MKKIFLVLSIFIILALACNLSASTPTQTPLPADATVSVDATVPAEATLFADATLPATEIAVEVPTATQPAEVPTEVPPTPEPTFDGAATFFRPLSLVLPPGLASGISGEQFPRADGADIPPWELTPGHTVVTLEGYLLQGKFHQPKIYVYPALGYAELFPGAFESMHRTRNVMNDLSLTSVNDLPGVPFFNAGQVFASNLQKITTEHIEGVRFLTEYAQYAAPVNNYELIYHFEGFSHDGEYYIVAIFPIIVPVVADTSDPGAPLPPGGVPYPDINDPNADFQSYYAAITDLLNNTSPDTFSPTISQLDLLIQSLQITP